MKKIIIPIMLLAFGAGGFAIMKASKPKAKPIEKPEQSWVVSTEKIEMEVIAPEIQLYGRVESPHTAQLRAASLTRSTEVIALEVLEGHQVKKGQILLRLDNSESQFNLQQREADVAEIKALIQSEQQRYKNDLASITHEENLLKLLQKSVNRAQRLEKQRVGSQSALDDSRRAVESQKLAVNQRRLNISDHKARLRQLQARLKRARAALGSAQREHERSTIKAPFSGIVAKIDVSIGDSVRTGDKLLMIYDSQRLEVRAQIPSRYQASLIDTTTGELPSLRASSTLNKQTIALQLDRTSGQVNNNSGGIDGLFRIEQGAQFLRLGQFVTLSLQLPIQKNVIALPYEALYGTDRVYKFTEQRMQRIAVERIGEYITATGKSRILIRSEQLKAGDEIIVTQLPNAIDGLKVRLDTRDVIETPAAPSITEQEEGNTHAS